MKPWCDVSSIEILDVVEQTLRAHGVEQYQYDPLPKMKVRCPRCNRRLELQHIQTGYEWYATLPAHKSKGARK
jgi:hypothetical protein